MNGCVAGCHGMSLGSMDMYQKICANVSYDLHIRRMYICVTMMYMAVSIIVFILYTWSDLNHILRHGVP